MMPAGSDGERGEEELTVKVLDIMRDTLDNKLISNYYELPTYIRVGVLPS